MRVPLGQSALAVPAAAPPAPLPLASAAATSPSAAVAASASAVSSARSPPQAETSNASAPTALLKINFFMQSSLESAQTRPCYRFPSEDGAIHLVLPRNRACAIGSRDRKSVV